MGWTQKGHRDRQPGQIEPVIVRVEFEVAQNLFVQFGDVQAGRDIFDELARVIDFGGGVNGEETDLIAPNKNLVWSWMFFESVEFGQTILHTLNGCEGDQWLADRVCWNIPNREFEGQILLELRFAFRT